jgi:hypothetical protein
MARTAVVAGTATAVSRKVNDRMNRTAQEKEAAALEGQMQEAQASEAQANVGGGDITTQIERLAQLKQSGAITEDEFNTAKSKLLAAA